MERVARLALKTAAVSSRDWPSLALKVPMAAAQAQTAGKEYTLALPNTGAVLRCNPDGSELEIFATGLRNPQELAFDEYGNLFTADNNSDSGDKARWVHVVEGGNSGWLMSYQYLPDRGPWNREKLWQPQHEGQPAYIIPPVANIADGTVSVWFGTGDGGSAADPWNNAQNPKSLLGKMLRIDVARKPYTRGLLLDPSSPGVVATTSVWKNLPLSGSCSMRARSTTLPRVGLVVVTSGVTSPATVISVTVAPTFSAGSTTAVWPT